MHMLSNTYTKLRKWCIMEKEIISFEKNGIPVRISQMERVGFHSRGIHSHIAIEIVTVKEGVLECLANGEMLELHPGQILLINSNISHRLFPGDARIIYMQIDISAYKERGAQEEFSNLHEFILRIRAMPYLLLESDREIENLFCKIHKRFYEERECSRHYLKAYLYELVAFLYDRDFIGTPAISPEKLEKIAPIVRYVDANYKLPITLEDICTASGYSKFSVCHTFKGVTGATVFDYINYLRIWQAVEELKRHKRVISAIAADCGFSSVTYFNRVFKNVMGCSPSVYRKYVRS